MLHDNCTGNALCMQRGNTGAVTDRSSDGMSLTQLHHYMGTVLGPANVPEVAAGKKKG